jgi:uncharacterized membrane protein YbhN (UPF0104 family)
MASKKGAKMNSDTITAAIMIASPFVLFLAFFLALFFQSRYYATNPPLADDDPRIKRRESIFLIGSIIIIILMNCALIATNHFQSSWHITICLTMSAFWFGTLSASKLNVGGKIKTPHSMSDP